MGLAICVYDPQSLTRPRFRNSTPTLEKYVTPSVTEFSAGSFAEYTISGRSPTE